MKKTLTAFLGIMVLTLTMTVSLQAAPPKAPAAPNKSINDLQQIDQAIMAAELKELESSKQEKSLPKGKRPATPEKGKDKGVNKEPVILKEELKPVPKTEPAVKVAPAAKAIPAAKGAAAPKAKAAVVAKGGKTGKALPVAKVAKIAVNPKAVKGVAGKTVAPAKTTSAKAVALKKPVPPGQGKLLPKAAPPVPTVRKKPVVPVKPAVKKGIVSPAANDGPAD